ncbi:hypothetical protein [Enhygromyxa salina]|uniref:Uncharacterized protein n=1 Tax=Enhygromyxa salina TaxID=215803 RepID=A0A2S9Y0J0_9BACT|nr:hypothetical protein [Enhygromyxa salina]PRP98521.1 hypothetical protein ENSA7_64640 [Enhygromyxa salina]
MLINEHTAQAAREHVSGMLDKSFRGVKSNKFLKVTVKKSRPPLPPKPLPDEVNDMARVDFECHPSEPLKIAEHWEDAPCCLICGRPHIAGDQ